MRGASQSAAWCRLVNSSHCAPNVTLASHRSVKRCGIYLHQLIAVVCKQRAHRPPLGTVELAELARARRAAVGLPLVPGAPEYTIVHIEGAPRRSSREVAEEDV